MDEQPGTEKNESVDQSNSLQGVKGWLKLFVVVNIYVAPVIFVIQYVVAWIGVSMLYDRYPGIAFVILIETAVGAFLVYKWITIAIRLRDIQPYVVQEAKLWLKLTLGWAFLSIPLSFMSGMPAETLAPGIVKVLARALIGFGIWYSYFNVSKRVKATYPDWDQEVPEDVVGQS